MNKQINAWQLYSCRTSYCRAEHWLARASQAQPELWHVASMADGVPWLVAAAEPACPFCGTALTAVLDHRANINAQHAA